MNGPIVGDEWRWPVIALGVACAGVILAIWAVKRRRPRRLSFHEAMSLWGGAAVCLCVTLSTAGVLFGWDPVWRLPPTAAALVYVLIGRGIELRQLTRKK